MQKAHLLLSSLRSEAALKLLAAEEEVPGEVADNGGVQFVRAPGLRRARHPQQSQFHGPIFLL